jgi:predicted transglutaminase-like cysteine proteinase
MKLRGGSRPNDGMASWEVNKDIVAARNEFGLASEAWRSAATAAIATTMLSPSAPELHDRGWPARALLLSEAIVGSGEHHLVFVVRTKAAI